MKLLITTQTVDKNDPILGFFHGWVLEFAKHFERVYVICLKKGDYDFPAHVEVFSLGKEEGENRIKYLVRFYRYFSRIFFFERVDYVLFHMGAIYNILAAPFFFMRKVFQTKFYWWKAHGHINMVGRIALTFVDQVFTSTESGFSIDTGKRYIVGQAVDTRLFTMPEGTLRQHHTVVYVGRIAPIKHIEDFIDTAELVTVKYPHARFLVVGPSLDKAYTSNLMQRCVDKGVVDCVIFLGPRQQVELVSLYQVASVFLNTSLTHSMDKTVLEAMLCGCIPVTGNRAFSDLLAEYGLFMSDSTPEQYARGVEDVFARNDVGTLRSQLRNRVTQYHGMDTFTHRIFGI